MTAVYKPPTYSREELYELWEHFKDSPEAVTLLTNFGLMSRAEAKAMILEFEEIRRKKWAEWSR